MDESANRSGKRWSRHSPESAASSFSCCRIQSSPALKETTLEPEPWRPWRRPLRAPLDGDAAAFLACLAGLKTCVEVSMLAWSIFLPLSDA